MKKHAKIPLRRDGFGRVFFAMSAHTKRKVAPLENIIALKLTNSSYFLGFLVALSDFPTGYFIFESDSYTFSSLFFSIAYLMCHLISNHGFDKTARILFIIIMCLHFGITLRFVGPYVGVEIYAICMLLVPMLIFSKTENYLMRWAYAIMAVFIAASEYIATVMPPILSLSEANRHSFYLTNLISIAIVVTFLMFFYSRSSITNYLELQSERNKSENMLRDLLPQTVAEKMIRGEEIVAQSYGECTVLFADLIGFTRLSERLSPIHLVELLNDIFTDIDVVCEKYGIEKIKTIGDCYMAATGALETRGQPTEMALLGLGIIEIVNSYAERTGYPLAVRVGINTGQVVSGVIGTKRRMFDIWGQTVNVAQLLESNCRPNSVFVSESMQWRLKHKFRFSDPCIITAKSGHAFNGYFILESLEDGIPASSII